MSSTFNTAPATLLGSGYSFDGTTLNIPLANLPLLTSAKANSSSGDARSIVLALLDAIYGNNSSAVAAGNGSDRFTISKASTNPDNAGQFSNIYQIAIQLSTGNISVLAE